MQINISARHLKLTEAINEYATKKVTKAAKFLGGDEVKAHVVLRLEKNRQITEVLFNIGKVSFKAKEQASDIYSSIDLAMDKLEKQLRKHKEISKIHRKENLKISKEKKNLLRDITSLDDSEDLKGKKYEVKKVDLKPITIETAIEDMDTLDYKVYMFLNRKTKKINVLYRSEGRTLTLLEPEI
ncbi:MAG: ribosome-associated translation inhibitor RaiA [Elusimicrobiota bacterium]|jgi:putative sigma-54 modulation protein|nr:ribosome-associated translation inhibitor RaiA [Elusimicrobiota bacterium]